MEKEPRVSIITPSFNQGDFIRKTISSVIDQNYSNIEYLIIDGGSTDKTLGIIKTYKKNIDYWVSEPDAGQADAINKGIVKSTGDFVCWVNSDDILYPDFIRMRMQQFKENPDIDLIYGDVDQGTSISETRLRKGKQTDFFQMLDRVNVPIPQQSAVWRSRVHNEVGYLETKWEVALDWEFFLRVSRYFKVLYLPGSSGFFRNHELSKSVSNANAWAIEIPQLYEEIFHSNIYQLTPKLLNKKKRYLISAYLYALAQAKNAGKTELASQIKRMAIEVDSALFYWKNSTGHLRKLRHSVVNLFAKS